MNYAKIDPALSAALTEVADAGEKNLVVFVHTESDPDAQQASTLQSLGAHDVAPGRQLFTATASARGIEQLADQPWVRSVRLAQKLRPKDRS